MNIFEHLSCVDLSVVPSLAKAQRRKDEEQKTLRLRGFA
jgi:hypothetical protein